MKQRVREAFDKIEAEEQLKQTTLQRVKANSQRPRPRRVRMRHIAAAAAMALVLMLGFGSYNTAYAYVDIEVNPAVELTLNRFDRVIGTRAYNEDGEALLQGLQLRNKSSENAITELMEAMDRQGYMVDGSLISVALQGANEESGLYDSIGHCVNKSVSHHYNATVEINTVTEEIKQQADDLNISAAKYLAILELQQVDPSVDAGHCIQYSIGELHEQTQRHRHGQMNENDSSDENDDCNGNGDFNDNDHGNGHGNGNGHH